MLSFLLIVKQTQQLIELDTFGKYARAQHWGKPGGHAQHSSLAIDAQDHVLLGGFYQTSIDFGGYAQYAAPKS